MSIKPLSYHGFSLDFLVAGSNREKEGKRPGDNMAWNAKGMSSYTLVYCTVAIQSSDLTFCQPNRVTTGRRNIHKSIHIYCLKAQWACCCLTVLLPHRNRNGWLGVKHQVTYMLLQQAGPECTKLKNVYERCESVFSKRQFNQSIDHRGRDQAWSAFHRHLNVTGPPKPWWGPTVLGKSFEGCHWLKNPV